MVHQIIAFSARHRFLVVALTGVAVLFALRALRDIPLDAIPDLSDTQVIVYSRWDRSPDLVEDQVTYPIVTALLGTPRVKAIRGFSDFGYSFVYAVFEDGTDMYWARSRVLEYLSGIQARLPDGVRTELGPDASGVGWVWQYALVDRTGRRDPYELRSFQDWYLKYWLRSVEGIAEVATVGGFEKQYQVTVDPDALAARGVPFDRVMQAIRDGNRETGGRVLEIAGAEFMVRGRGYAASVQDLERIVVATDAGGVPVTVGDVATVGIGPEMRRGIGDLDGRGDTVSGIVVMRHGENALRVIDRVRERVREIAPSLPEGVEIVPVYDRSRLIEEAIDVLEHELLLAMVIVSLVILVFLWHLPSAVVPIVTIPVSVLLAFLPMWALGITSNIMSLAGIAISIGVLVDGAIIEVENAYNRIHRWQAAGRPGDFRTVRLEALQEVGPSVFFSLLVIAVSFLPIFVLVDQEGRLFRPLAYTKNLTMAIAALLAITLDPAIRMMFARADPFSFRPAWLARVASAFAVGTYRAEERHPVSRILIRAYEPVCRAVLERPKTTVALAVLAVLSTVPVYFALGSEFMPPLDEGALLYMPTTLPGVSVGEAEGLLRRMDEILAEVPEVRSVYGKAGRADTATDPAPLSMIETVIELHPPERWRKVERWYSGAPEFLRVPLRAVWPDRMTREELVADLDARMRFPGVTNAWTMPIKARIDMLSTGVRTPVGIKVLGPDLAQIEALGAAIEAEVRRVPGTRSAFAERTVGGYFVDIVPDRGALARLGISMAEFQDVVSGAIGGEPITTTIEGRERYTVSVRYPRELRDDPEALRRIRVASPGGSSVPLGQLADVRLATGPGMIRNEGGQLAGYVFVDIADSDIGGYVRRAKEAVTRAVEMPPGYTLQWSGQYENMLRVRERLRIVVPITILLIVVILQISTGSAVKTAIVVLAVPFSLVGAIWLLWLLDYNVSIAVWVGMIALMGLDAETGVFMLLFLDLSYEDARRRGRLRNRAELREAVVHGAAQRIRPKTMTVASALLGLLPVMLSTGAGSDMMKRVVAPLLGGLVTSFALELLVYPPLYEAWKWRTEVRNRPALP